MELSEVDGDDVEDDERHEGHRDVHRRSCRLRGVRWSIVRPLPLATPLWTTLFARIWTASLEMDSKTPGAALMV